MTESGAAEHSSLHFDLVVHLLQPRDLDSDVADQAFLLGGIDRTAECDLALVGDNLNVFVFFGAESFLFLTTDTIGWLWGECYGVLPHSEVFVHPRFDRRGLNHCGEPATTWRSPASHGFGI